MNSNEDMKIAIHEKLDKIIQKVQDQKEQINNMQQQITLLEAEKEAKENEISTLYTQLAQKDKELNEFSEKINAALED